MKDFSQFEQKINVTFSNKDLLAEALTHRSYLNENSSWRLPHNERLEFLGDAVLELVTTEFLFKKYPSKPEGELTNFRAALVNANMLSRVATEMRIGDFILLSHGEARDTGRARSFILANAFEALIGALYLDADYAVAKKTIEQFLLPKIDEVLEKGLFRDSKSLFQEKAQEKNGITPAYRVLKEWGPDHDRHFLLGVYLGSELIAEGEGPSKQIAEQKAAEAALEKKGWA